MRKIRVIANANKKNLPSIHVYNGPTGPTGLFETCTQVGATGATGQIKTVQGITGPTAGVKNIIISGYTGPA